jgi:hypothetical protein
MYFYSLEWLKQVLMHFCKLLGHQAHGHKKCIFQRLVLIYISSNTFAHTAGHQESGHKNLFIKIWDSEKQVRMHFLRILLGFKGTVA